MTMLKQTLIVLSGLGLIACGGGGEETGDNGGGNNGASNTLIDIQIEPTAVSARPYIILEGGAVEPKHLTFDVTSTRYGDGNLEQEDRYRATLDQAITPTFKAFIPDSDIDFVASELTSSDPSVVAFENGRLVGKAPGKASISLTISTSIPLSEATQSLDLEVQGFPKTVSFGEITVCPFTDITFNAEGKSFQDPNTTMEITGFENENIDNAWDGDVGISIIPKADYARLEEYGLTPLDCKPVKSTAEQNENAEAGLQITNRSGTLINSRINLSDITTSQGAVETTGLSLHGIDLPNITLSRITTFSNPRITEVGFNGNIVLDTANPITIMATSSELGRDVNVTPIYLSSSENGGYQVPGLSIQGWRCTWAGVSNYCVDSTATSHTVSLSIDGFPTVTSAELPVVDGIPKTSLSPVSGEPGTIFTITSSLQVGDTIFDTSDYIGGIADINRYKMRGDYESETTGAGRFFTFYTEGVGELDYIHLNSNLIPFIIGPPTDSNIRGRWVQVDTGQDHYIGAHSTETYTAINDNQLTFQDDQNREITLVRAGIDNVAVSGQINVVEEAIAPTPQTRSVSPQARSLAGVASIDMILKNVNTGEETPVTVAEDGTFNEEVATGIYDVEGTVEDGEITYAINTQITVEKDATDTGKLNLAKVGLYNFDVSISGCAYDYKCYAGQQYTFTITAKNTGAIASSAVEAVIGDISSHENVSQFEITSRPITGAAPGDSIQYNFTATFTQPAEDTVIEIPFSLSDADGRTWEDTVKITVSQHDSTTVRINAYNGNTAANVRGYLMLEGRTPIRVSGDDIAIFVPNKPGANYELILANQEYNQETPYAVSFNTTTSNQEISDATGIISKNENADDVITGATELAPGESNISYISAGDVDYYLLTIPENP